MKFAVVYSKKDTAGMNIASFISSLPKHFVDCDIINAENIDEKPELKDKNFIIFASKHQGKKEKMLSVHAPGNWRKAELGGKPERVCKTSSIILKTFFQEINKNIPKEWESTLECTHHGPYIEKPCLFIEIGSSEKEWKDKHAGGIIAETIKQAIDSFNKKEDKKFISSIGIGGPHYCPNFNKIQLNSKYAIGHIIPEHALPLTEEMLQEAINKTIPKPEIILLDWKGLGKSEQRQQIIELLKKSGLEFKRTSEVEK